MLFLLENINVCMKINPLARYTNRSSYMDRDDMEFPEGDEDMLEDDVFVELEEPVDEQ